VQLDPVPEKYQKLLKQVNGYDDYLCRKVIAIYRGQMVPEEAIREGVISFNIRWSVKPPPDYGNSLRRCITYAWDKLQKKTFRENAEKVAREREEEWKEKKRQEHRDRFNLLNAAHDQPKALEAIRGILDSLGVEEDE